MKRYDLEYANRGLSETLEMEEDATGEWVRYEDTPLHGVEDPAAWMLTATMLLRSVAEHFEDTDAPMGRAARALRDQLSHREPEDPSHE